jgi:NarL family two-component system response regulator LiaR
MKSSDCRRTSINKNLTTREKEMIELLSSGLSYKQIAFAANVSTNTVRNHLSSARAKLGAHNTVELLNSVGCFKQPLNL